MTVTPLSDQLRQNQSSSGNSESMYTALQRRCTGMFTSMTEYFWPTPTDAPALADRAFDVERAEGFNAEQSTRYDSTIRCVVLVAAAVGIATIVTYWVRSALCADGNTTEPNGVTSEALSAALATTGVIGRRLLSAVTDPKAIADQSAHANAPFNLQIDLGQAFNYILPEFSDPDGDFVVPNNIFKNPYPGVEESKIYTATLTTGEPLPAWLNFDPITGTFAGTPPGRKDTNLLSTRLLPIRLTASNDSGSKSVDFIINVLGESDLT